MVFLSHNSRFIFVFLWCSHFICSFVRQPFTLVRSFVWVTVCSSLYMIKLRGGVEIEVVMWKPEWDFGELILLNLKISAWGWPTLYNLFHDCGGLLSLIKEVDYRSDSMFLVVSRRYIYPPDHAHTNIYSCQKIPHSLFPW